MTIMIATEYDDTARIVLMEMHDNKNTLITLLNFSRPMREQHPEIRIEEIAALWTRYMGFDQRKLPTHDFRTGAPR